MSSDNKWCIRFFTIADYEDEEAWLREMSNKGYMLKKVVFPCFYYFEKCECRDIVYRLELETAEVNFDEGYTKMLEDYGWSYLFKCMDWRYYCKEATEGKEECEIFTDDASRLGMVKRVFTVRFLPGLLILLSLWFIFLFWREGGGFRIFTTVVVLSVSLLYIYCGVKIRRLMKKYGG